MNCEYKKKGRAPFHFLKISVDKFLIDVNFLWIGFTLLKKIRIILLFAGGNPARSCEGRTVPSLHPPIPWPTQPGSSRRWAYLLLIISLANKKSLDTSCPTCSYLVIKYASIFCDTRNRMFHVKHKKSPLRRPFRYYRLTFMKYLLLAGRPRRSKCFTFL